MRRITNLEGGVPDPVTGKMVFPEAPDEGVLEPSYMNMIQEEISTLIEAAGLTLDPARTDQLQNAIRKNMRISANLDLYVGSGLGTYDNGINFLTLQEAIDSIVGRYIEPGFMVTINTDLNTQAMSVPLRVPLRQGRQVTIKGPYEGNLESINDTLDFSSFFTTGNGAYIDIPPGCGVMFENINFIGRTGSTTSIQHMFKVRSGAYVFVKNSRITDVRGVGVLADAGGYAELDLVFLNQITDPINNAARLEPKGSCVVSTNGGYVYGKTVTTGVATFESFVSVDGSSMYLESCVADEKGFLACRGSVMTAKFCTGYDQGSDGDNIAFHANDGGVMFLNACNAGRLSPANNPPWGFLAKRGSKIFANGCNAWPQVAGFAATSNSIVSCTNTVNTGGANGYVASDLSIITHNDDSTAGSSGLSLFSPSFGTSNTTSLSRIGEPDYV